MGTNVVICAGPNHLGTRYTSWTAASTYSASHPASNLATRKPSQRWRSENLNPYKCALYGFHDVDSLLWEGALADSVALVGHNLRQVSGRVRFRLMKLGGTFPPALPAYIAPNDSYDDVNTTGSHTDVDDNLAAGADDGNEIGPSTPNVAWSKKFRFTAPGSTPQVGSSTDRRMMFIARLHHDGADDLDPATDQCPTVQVNLYEGGAQVRILGTKLVTSATEQFLIWEWDISELSDPDGSDAELYFIATPRNSLNVKLEAIGWWCEVEDFNSGFAGATKLIADTGWLQAVDDLTASSAFGAFTPTWRPRRETTMRRFDYVGYQPPGDTEKVMFMQVLIADDQSPVTSSSFAVGRTPQPIDGWVEAGVGWLSNGLQLPINRDLGELVTFHDPSIRLETPGGNLGGQILPRRRIVSLPIEEGGLSANNAMSILDRIAWEGSILDPVVVSLFPANDTMRRHTTIHGVLMDADNTLKALRNSVEQPYGLSLRFLEMR